MKIRVGPHTYRVFKDRAKLAGLGDVYSHGLAGHCDTDTHEIVVEPNQAHTAFLETLLHETLHAVTNVTGFMDEWGMEKEEAFVRRFAPALLDLLRQNPDLVKKLLS